MAFVNLRTRLPGLRSETGRGTRLVPSEIKELYPGLAVLARDPRVQIVFREAVLLKAKELQRRIKSDAPVRTGKLRERVQVRVRKLRGVRTSYRMSAYAPYVKYLRPVESKVQFLKQAVKASQAVMNFAFALNLSNFWISRRVVVRGVFRPFFRF